MMRIGVEKFKHYPMFFVATCLFLCNFLTLSIPFKAFGQAIYEQKGVFTVANIHVDVTAKTASAARKKALEKGEKQSYSMPLMDLGCAQEIGTFLLRCCKSPTGRKWSKAR